MVQPVKIHELSKESQRLYDVLNGESDMSMVIVATSFLDSAIHALLVQFLNRPGTECARNELFNSALGGLRTRATLAFCLGLLSKKTFEDVRTIAGIRNQFAHLHQHVGFDAPEIRERCRKLKWWEVMSFGEDSAEAPKLSDEQLVMIARNQFKLSALMAFNRIVLDAMSVEVDPTYRPQI